MTSKFPMQSSNWTEWCLFSIVLPLASTTLAISWNITWNNSFLLKKPLQNSTWGSRKSKNLLVNFFCINYMVLNVFWVKIFSILYSLHIDISYLQCNFVGKDCKNEILSIDICKNNVSKVQKLSLFWINLINWWWWKKGR